MASFYLVKTGNWSDASIWSATSGGAGGAGVPTDNDFVYVEGGHTVKLTSDVNNFFYVVQFYAASGFSVLDLNGYSFKTQDGGITGSGKIKFSGGALDTGSGYLVVTNLDLLNGTATFSLGYISSFSPTMTNTSSANLTVNVNYGTSSTFDTGSNTFQDVRFNLSSTSDTLDITGSPTFRLLDIRSANSAAHTVRFATGVRIVDKFIAVGSSTSNKLTLSDIDYSVSTITFEENATCYGKNIHIYQLEAAGYASSTTPTYIGTGSTQANGIGWLTQDPPKISTLVDPLTTAPGSNSNWTVSGTVTTRTDGAEGGGYKIHTNSEIVSTDTFDFIGSEVIFERLAIQGTPNGVGGYFGGNGIGDFGDTSPACFIASRYAQIMSSGERTEIKSYFENSYTAYFLYPYPTSSSSFVKFAIDYNGYAVSYYSDDGLNWHINHGEQLDDMSMAILRSARVVASRSSSIYQLIGSINPSLNATPATTLNSPADSAQLSTLTPQLKFTGTDGEGEDITYQLEYDTNQSFTSPTTVNSDTDPGFSGTDPYSSGTQVTYTVQSALNNDTTYYWRVRGKDPTGSNTFGGWSATYNFHINISSRFFQFF